MTVSCYPVKNKAKSLDICRAFAHGCGGIVYTNASKLEQGPAFFYGVDESNLHLWEEIRLNVTRDYYYCDNSYFDTSRQQYFRVTKNALQHSGKGTSDGVRFKKLEIKIKSWQAYGVHIVICPQSEHFMQTLAQYPGYWQHDIQARLAHLTRRNLRLRLWSSDKGRMAGTLEQDLEGAHALVTYSSAAAVTAVLNGVPAFCSSSCAAAPMGLTDLKDIEKPVYPEGRENWAGVLADNQWTLEEMRSGKTWRDLNG